MPYFLAVAFFILVMPQLFAYRAVRLYKPSKKK